MRRHELLIAAVSIGLLLEGNACTQKPGAREQKGHSQAELIAFRDKKLESDFLSNAAWLTNYETALVRSKKTGKLILVYFTRSYSPLPPCEALENGLFASSAFKKVGDKVVLFIHITSRVKTDPHQELLRAMGGTGFPYIIVIDEAGRRVAQLGGEWTLAGIHRMLDGDVAEYTSLRDRASQGEKAAKAAFFIKRLGLGHLEPAEIQKTLATADYLSSAQVATIRRSLASLEIMEILSRIVDSDRESATRAAKRILAMKRGGRIPSSPMDLPFWQVLLTHAQETENSKLFAEALSNIEKIPAMKDDKQWLERMRTQLRALQFMDRRKKKDGG